MWYSIQKFLSATLSFNVDLMRVLGRIILEDALFWLTFCFDMVLAVSLSFAIFCAVALGLRSLLPQPFFRPRAWGLPALFLLALWVPYSSPGQQALQVLANTILLIMRCFPSEHVPLILAMIWLLKMVWGLTLLQRKIKTLHSVLSALPELAHPPVLQKALALMKFQIPLIVKYAEPEFSVASWSYAGHACVIIPEGFEKQYSPEEQLGIYLHELSHIKNRDSLKCVVMAVLECLMWFNPLVKEVFRRYRCHLEIICDAAVATMGPINSEQYAGLIFKHATQADGLLTGFSCDYQAITRRFSYLLHDPALCPVKRDRVMAGVCLTLSLFFLVSFYFQPRVTESRTEFLAAVANYAELYPDRSFQIDFFWQGVLGSYSKSTAVATDPSAASLLSIP